MIITQIKKKLLKELIKYTIKINKIILYLPGKAFTDNKTIGFNLLKHLCMLKLLTKKPVYLFIDMIMTYMFNSKVMRQSYVDLAYFNVTTKYYSYSSPGNMSV